MNNVPAVHLGTCGSALDGFHSGIRAPVRDAAALPENITTMPAIGSMVDEVWHLAGEPSSRSRLCRGCFPVRDRVM